MWNIAIPLQRPLFMAKQSISHQSLAPLIPQKLLLSQVRGAFSTLLPHALSFGLCTNPLFVQGYGWCKAAWPKGFTAGFTVALSVWAAPSRRAACCKAAASSQPRTTAGLSLNIFLSSSDWSPVKQITNVTWDITLISVTGLSSPEHSRNPPQKMWEIRKISFGKIYLPWDKKVDAKMHLPM